MSDANLRDNLNDLAYTQAVKMAGYVRDKSHEFLRSLLANENNFAGISVSDVALHPSNSVIANPSEDLNEVPLTDTVSSFNSSESRTFSFASGVEEPNVSETERVDTLPGSSSFEELDV
jgi:hypothetical protein